MRILLVSQMYPGPDDPDLGVFVAQGEQALRERGHEIELAVTRPPVRRESAISRAAPARAQRRAARRRVGPLPRAGWPHRVEVDAPLVVTAHGRDVRNIGSIPGVALLTRRVVRSASTVVAVSEYLRRELEERVPEARGKTAVVDSGVDLERFRAVTPAAELEYRRPSSMWAR